MLKSKTYTLYMNENQIPWVKLLNGNTYVIICIIFIILCGKHIALRLYFGLLFRDTCLIRSVSVCQNGWHFKS